MEEDHDKANAGWYPDPDQPRGQRYWDGEQWTDYKVDYPSPASDNSPTGIGHKPGWYDAPDQENSQRFWDGDQWTATAVIKSKSNEKKLQYVVLALFALLALLLTLVAIQSIRDSMSSDVRTSDEMICDLYPNDPGIYLKHQCWKYND